MKRWIEPWERWASRASDHCWWLLGLFALLTAMQINPYWWPGEDASHYLTMARNWVQGRGIMPFGESRMISPPGYPLVLSLAFYFFGDAPFLAISVLHWLMGLAVMFGVYFWARPYDAKAAPYLAGLVVLGASFSMHNRTTLTESTFMAALIWAVLVLRLAVHHAGNHRVWLWSGLGALMIGLTVSVRLLGVVLLAGFALAMVRLAWQRKTGWGRSVSLIALVSTPTILGVAALLIHHQQPGNTVQSPMSKVQSPGDTVQGPMSNVQSPGDTVQGPKSKVQSLGDTVQGPMSKVQSPMSKVQSPGGIPGGIYFKPLAARLVQGQAGGLSEGVRLRVNEIGRLIIPGMVKAYDKPPTWFGINTIVYLLPTTAVLIGWWRLVRREGDVLALAAPWYVLLLVLWPYDQAERFGLPMLPLMWLCVWSVLAGWRLFSFWPGAKVGMLAILLIAHIGVAASWWWHDFEKVRAMNQDWPALKQIAAIVGQDDRRIDGWRAEHHQRLMLRFLINRPVSERKVVEGMSPQVRWLLMSKVQGPTSKVLEESPGVEGVPGFEERMRQGRLILLQRRGS